MTRRPTFGRDFAQYWPFGLTPVHGMWAARMEMAAAWRIQWRRNFPFDRLVISAPLINPRHFIQQRLRIGMIGFVEQGIG